MALTRRTVLLSKIEATYGVDPTPGVNDALLIADPQLSVDGQVLTRDFLRESLSPLPHRIGNKAVDLTFSTELKGGGAAGTVPRFDPLLRACGLQAITIAGREVRYRPRSTSFESCMIYVYLEGMLQKLKGCRGTVELVLEAGQVGKLNFTVKGLYTRPTDQAIITGNPDTALPPVAKSAGFAIGTTAVTGEAVGTGNGAQTVFNLANGKVGLDTEVVRVNAVAKTKHNGSTGDYHIDYHAGELTFLVAPPNGQAVAADYSYSPYAAVVGSLQLANNNVFALRTDLNSADFKAVEINGRGSAGSFNPESVTEATYPFWQRWEDSVAQGLALKIGTAAGNIIQVLAPAIISNQMAWGDKEGIRIYDIPFGLTGDDKELELCFR